MKARELAESKNIKDFKEFPSWINRFMRRNNLQRNILYIFSCNKHCFHGLISFHIICLKCDFLKFFDFTTFKHNQILQIFAVWIALTKCLIFYIKSDVTQLTFQIMFIYLKFHGGAPNILTGLYIKIIKHVLLSLLLFIIT